MGEIRLRNVAGGGCGRRGARERPASGAGDDKASLGESWPASTKRLMDLVYGFIQLYKEGDATYCPFNPHSCSVIALCATVKECVHTKESHTYKVTTNSHASLM